MEYETTVSLVFGGEIYNEIYNLLGDRHHTEEHLDVYTCKQSDGAVQHSAAAGRHSRFNAQDFKYRELKQCLYKEEGGAKQFNTLWDRKVTERCVESQVPYIDEPSGRIIFITATYKSSYEETLTAKDWAAAVHEDHATASCLRTANKHRSVFPPHAFADLFNGSVPSFSRLSLGEYSTYGGTLEARSKCNPIYYLEIEHEHAGAVKQVGQEMLRLVALLFAVLPYNLVARALRKDATATVRRECIDNIFDTFKRRFVDYNRLRIDLWKAVGRQDGKTDGDNHHYQHHPPVRAFVMPKWDGMKATANYCDGFIFIRDSCGALSTYRADLPFDNDLMLQLEIVDDPDSRQKILVVTEIMAVVVTNHNTLYHTYSRNNSLHNTGRYAGNVSHSITLKKQFKDPNNICNTYRLVDPLYSLLAIHYLSAKRWALPDSRTPLAAATNTYMQSDRPLLFITTVVRTSERHEIQDLLRLLDQFHNYPVGGAKQSRPDSVQEERENKKLCLTRLREYFPKQFAQDRLIDRLCEGLLVAFVRGAGGGRRRRWHLPDHGYIKVKLVDTIDLQYCISVGLATSASAKHTFRVQNVPQKFPGWAERSTPIQDDKVIIECRYDRTTSSLVFVKDRPDKTRADSDEKISAIDGEIISKCSIVPGGQ